MSYKIIRMHFNPKIPKRTIKRGLTWEQAQEHCKDPETSSSTCTKPHNKRRTQQLGA